MRLVINCSRPNSRSDGVWDQELDTRGTCAIGEKGPDENSPRRGRMALFKNYRIELVLAAIFVGLFAASAARTWGHFFFVPGLAMTGAVLFPAYLVLVLMFRHHCSWRDAKRTKQSITRTTKSQGRPKTDADSFGQRSDE